MIKKPTRHLWLLVITLVVLLAGTGLLWRMRHEVRRSLERASLPMALPYSAPAATPLVTSPEPEVATPTAVDLPAQINLAVPFTVQAPHANWDEAHKEFCEEASILMVISYVTNQDIPTPDVAEQKLQELKVFEEDYFGYYKDTTIEEVATTFREHYDYHKLRLVKNPTIEEIKQALANGQLIIVPAAGRLLGNPYFTQPGPLYHMLVIKGYTKDNQFIVHDPGTRRGADYLYTEAVLLHALHNWRTDEQIEAGQKVILVVG